MRTGMRVEGQGKTKDCLVGQSSYPWRTVNDTSQMDELWRETKRATDALSQKDLNKPRLNPERQDSLSIVNSISTPPALEPDRTRNRILTQTNPTKTPLLTPCLHLSQIGLYNSGSLTNLYTPTRT